MDKEQTALERLRTAAQMSEQFYHAPLIVTTSGGKDSSVCVALARVLGCRRETASRWAKANGVERLGSPAKYFSGDVARAIVNGGK